MYSCFPFLQSVTHLRHVGGTVVNSGNSRNNAGEKSAILCNLLFGGGRRVARGGADTTAARGDDGAEPKGIETKLRPRPHRKNVTNDSAHARRCALEWFDRTGMIVRFDLESDCPAVADIHHASILFTGFNEDIRTGSREFSQFFARVFVGAMLAPHDGENPELSEVRLPPKNPLNSLEFLGRQTVLRHDSRSYFWFGIDGGHRHAAA